MNLVTPTDLPTDLHTTCHRLTAGQILLQQGEPAKNLYWVESGQLRLVSFVNQRMITHYFVGEGELLAESALQFDTYACTVIAETAAKVWAIPTHEFAAALKRSPTLSELYLANLTRRFQATKNLLELRSISSARDRILHYLMQRLPAGENTVILDKPLKMLASDLAMTPEGLSRLLSRLQTEGIITRKKRSISFSKEWLEDVAE